MALISCPECKKKISDSANNCPSCGYKMTADDLREAEKIKKREKNIQIGCLSVFFIIFIIYLFSSSNSPKKSTPQEIVKIDKSDQMQQKRKQLIEDLINKHGVFAKVEVPGSLPRVWVNPIFYTLDFETKKNFISVVYAYYFNGNNDTDTVRIFDNITGKEIGTYNIVNHGLKLD